MMLHNLASSPIIPRLQTVEIIEKFQGTSNNSSKTFYTTSIQVNYEFEKARKNPFKSEPNFDSSDSFSKKFCPLINELFMHQTAQ